jgi:hypothetical protein
MSSTHDTREIGLKPGWLKKQLEIALDDSFMITLLENKALARRIKSLIYNMAVYDMPLDGTGYLFDEATELLNLLHPYKGVTECEQDVQHTLNCELGENWLDCPACVEQYNSTASPAKQVLMPDKRI